MVDIFHSSRYFIEHARRRITEFEREATTFHNSNPYSRVVETNVDGTEDFHKIKLTQSLPVALPGIAFDALNALRSALDQAGHSVGIAANTNGKNSHFPFGDTLANVEGQKNGRSKDLPKEIFDLMVSFKPYKGGNDLLWALNKLCNSQKHEVIIPVAVATGGGNIEHAYFEKLISFAFPPKWDSVKNEMIIAHLPHGTTCSINLTVQAFIAFTKIDAVDGRPVDGVLNELARIVERAVTDIEAETRRLGLV